MRKKILVVDDSMSLRRILEDVLESRGYDVTSAENGEVAFDIIKGQNFPVVLTDLEMPVMQGDELIDRMNTLDEVPVTVVLTSDDDSNRITDIMRKGVFDYMIKPVKKADLIISIENAFKISELRRLKRIAEKERTIRFERHREMFAFMKRHGHDGSKADENTHFENLQRAMNRGAGLGAMFSLVELLAASSRKNEGNYEIDGRTMSKLMDVRKTAHEAMAVFSEIEKVPASQIEMEQVTFKQLYDEIMKIIKDLEGVSGLRGHTLVPCDEEPYFSKMSIQVNREYIVRVIREMLLNAMKYSEGETPVYTVLEKEGGDMVFSVINSTKSAADDGIPMEYENIVFEPFFRKVKYIQDEYKTLDCGLGLTLAERIVHRHNGKISICNIQDYPDISKNPATRVRCRLVLPVYGSTGTDGKKEDDYDRGMPLEA